MCARLTRFAFAFRGVGWVTCPPHRLSIDSPSIAVSACERERPLLHHFFSAATVNSTIRKGRNVMLCDVVCNVMLCRVPPSAQPDAADARSVDGACPWPWRIMAQSVYGLVYEVM